MVRLIVLRLLGIMLMMIYGCQADDRNQLVVVGSCINSPANGCLCVKWCDLASCDDLVTLC